MKKHLVFLIFALLPSLAIFSQHDVLPGENNKIPAITYDYFPSRLHVYVWRNWFLLPTEHLAQLVDATPSDLTAIATAMGLPEAPQRLTIWSTTRGYITVIRRNWHLLPYSQLLKLLKMSREELSWRMIEDDFLSVKLGDKPYCEELSYTPPTEEMNRKAQQIKDLLADFGPQLFEGETPRFSFLSEFDSVTNRQNNYIDSHHAQFDIRMIFPYFTDYGDPLMDHNLSSYPEGLLQKLSSLGVNAIWIHSVLNSLVPPKANFPGDENYKKRVDGLAALVQRAKKWGINVFLYTNEPRALPVAFFDESNERKTLGGVKKGDVQAFCTSNQEVLDWLTDSYTSLFQQIPDLGGVFTITASENLTSCVSHRMQDQCPYCSKKSYAQIVADINLAIHKGVKKGSPKAQVIVWDWGWDDTAAEGIIKKLPKDCYFMSVSEWHLPIERGGVQSSVGEYSISSVGPGPRALKHWKLAKKYGLKTIAKVQVNCTWELAIVPYLPVMDLIATHAENLKKEQTDGVLLSWSLGGYPSLNLELFQSIVPGKKDASLNAIAQHYYGKEAAPYIRKAWTHFSTAYKEYPYHISVLYYGPQQMGASNPLFLEPTNYKSTMVGLPYDDIASWTAIYPPEIWIQQMNRVSNGFKTGNDYLQLALDNSEKANERIKTDLNYGKIAQIHFSSSANQATFILTRNAMKEESQLTEEKQEAYHQKLLTCIEDEIKSVVDLLPLVKEEAKAGYESSNQYFYLPIDLIEKYINLFYLKNRLNSNRTD